MAKSNKSDNKYHSYFFKEKRLFMSGYFNKQHDEERIKLMKEIVFLEKEFLRCCSTFDLHLFKYEDSSSDIFEEMIDKHKEFVDYISDCDVDNIDSSVHKDKFTLFNLKNTRDEFLDDVEYIKNIIKIRSEK